MLVGGLVGVVVMLESVDIVDDLVVDGVVVVFELTAFAFAFHSELFGAAFVDALVLVLALTWAMTFAGEADVSLASLFLSLRLLFLRFLPFLDADTGDAFVDDASESGVRGVGFFTFMFTPSVVSAGVP